MWEGGKARIGNAAGKGWDRGGLTQVKAVHLPPLRIGAGLCRQDALVASSRRSRGGHAAVTRIEQAGCLAPADTYIEGCHSLVVMT